MADRVAEVRLDLAVGAERAHRQQRDLVVEVDEALDDDAAVTDPTARHRVVPGRLDILRTVEPALALAGAAHHRLDHAGIADAGVDRRLQLLERVAEAVGAGRQAERLGGEAADALAVHRQARGAGGRDDAHDALGLQPLQLGRGDGLDLGHHQVGPLGLDQRAQLRRIAHRDRAGVVRDLLAGRVVVAVDRDRLDAEALQRDQHFLAELAAAEQHDAGGMGGQRGSDRFHAGSWQDVSNPPLCRLA